VQQRDDEIRGTDDSFFFFDTKSDYVSVTQDVPENKNIVGPVDVTKLRCFAGIYRNPSAVKDPVIKRYFEKQIPFLVVLLNYLRLIV